MPWKISDVDEHYKDLNAKEKAAWINIANNAFFEGMKKKDAKESDSSAAAIRIANKAMARMLDIGDLSTVVDSQVTESRVDLSESAIDRDNKIIKNVRFIAKGWSLNGKYYSKEALTTLIPFLKEARVMFVNHRNVAEGRDLKDLVSTIESIQQMENGDLRGDIKMVGNPATEWLFNLVESNPTAVGLSIYAYIAGERGKKEGKEGLIVSRFIGAHSVDWVYKPGAKGGFTSEMSVPLGTFAGMAVLECLDNRMSPDSILERFSSSITADTAVENFEKEYYLRVLRELGCWFSDYIYYNILYNSTLKTEQKNKLVDESLAFFSKLYKDILKESNITKYDTPYDYLEASKESAIEKYPELAKYTDTISEFLKRHETKEKTMDLKTLSEIRESNPTGYALIMAEATQEAQKVFETAKTVIETDLKAAKDRITTLENSLKEITTERDTLKTTSTELTTKVTTLEADVKKFKDAEVAKEAETKKNSRNKLIDNLCTEHKIDRSKISDKFMKVFESENQDDTSVTEMFKVLMSVQNTKANNMGIKPATEKATTEQTGIKTVEQLENNMFPPVKK